MANWVSAGSVKSLQEEKAKVIKGGIGVFYHEGDFYAVDNRCPHMGFPLHTGSLCDGILTCHWHHARFDVCSGGTLDPWADDVPVYETKEENGELWVNQAITVSDKKEKYKQRLMKGLEQNLGLVIAKSVVGLINANVPAQEIIKIGIQFGTTHRNHGWGPGLTILTAMSNSLPKLDTQGRIQALYQGLRRVAGDCAGQPPKHLIGPLSGFIGNADRLKTWYRNCTEVRDSQGAERIVLTAVESGMPDEELSSMMMTAATDHFYMDAGHLLDFHNKAFEAAELADTNIKKSIFASLTPLFSNAVRSEELHSWQAPVNLVTPLKDAFQEVDGLSFPEDPVPFNEKELLEVILSDQPITMIDALTERFKNGASPVKVAQIVSLAAAERIVRFHIQNDFNDWITVLHTFTHAHAVHESLRRTNEPALIRAVYHAAVSVYLDRFLNIPSTKRPVGQREDEPLKADDFLKILDIQQQVNEAGQWAANYLHQNKDTDALFNTLGHALLREDADFHSYQMYEAASREFDLWSGEEEGNALAEYARETMIIAAARYLAAHAPTAREIPRVGKIAWRLHYGEKLFEDNES